MKAAAPSKASKRGKQTAAARLNSLLAVAPRHVRRDYEARRAAIAALDAAPFKHKSRTARIQSRRLGLAPHTLWTLRSETRKHGNIALLNKQFSAACWSNRRPGLPPKAIAHLKNLAKDDALTLKAIVNLFTGQLARWKKGDASASIPGYDQPPKGNPPPGWSARNLARCIGKHPRKRSQRVLFAVTLEFRADDTVAFVKTKGHR
jgi:hypothetical protein